MVGSDGNLWFTEQTGNNIGRITPKTGAIREFAVPTASSVPDFITPGPALSATVWFTEYTGNKIGEVSTK
jgi:virginiamycin B lyase